ncbi:MAG: hypothetical protein K6T91_11195 [Firmicutes bacterium]|nr:hypothetical protein [Bacillota bacterium]
MGLRAYLLVNVADDIDQKQFIQAVRELEEITGVDFVDPVVGSCDMVVMVEAPVSIEALVNEISTKPWVRKVDTVRIVGIFERGWTSWEDVC